jgi:hypothetical protein
MRRLTFAVALMLVLGAVALLSKRSVSESTGPAFTPNSTNDKVLSVRGWSELELNRILRDFDALYEIKVAHQVEAIANSQNTFRVSFPADISAELFQFLVNYVAYPKGLDLTNRRIGVIGHTTITSDFGPPDPTLLGRQARIYVPRDDRDFDLVYILTSTGKVYQCSFMDMKWREVSDSRKRDEDRGL